MVKINSDLEIKETTASSITNAEIGAQKVFIDSADNTLKTKDSTGTVNQLSNPDDKGFLIIDDSTISYTGATQTLKRKYTINKAIDGLFFSSVYYNNNSSNQGEIRFYKNGVQILSSKIFTISSNMDSGGAPVYFSSSANYIVVSGQPPVEIGMTIYVDDYFTDTDTFEIWMSTNSGNYVYSSKRILQGIKNKSTNTDWVTIS